MADAPRSYVPAAGIHLLLPLYDPLARLLGADGARVALVDDATLRPGLRVLDLGCGTGTLLSLIGTRHPEVEAIGLDPDPRALARASAKLTRAGVRARLDQGYSDALPYADASFDRVFSSFVLHHLEPAEKRATLAEIRRVLRPGGTFHLLDFGGPGGHVHGLLGRLVHRRPRLHEQLGDGLLALLQEAGFAEAALVREQGGRGGPIAWYRAAA